MSESPQNNRTGTNSHCESNDTSFLIPQEPVRSPDPLLFTQELVRSPTLTLPEVNEHLNVFGETPVTPS
ncbi:hypothetical protein Bca52824_088715 [Brassica carinata]|uniref:Uncharacterized protein n=1 Tax=Brassica carinata TaxID=52824 RepID=A0A8X7PE62_BRACI|nr:hypothetical protein Bca52824_088715 [Brassica carinata]